MAAMGSQTETRNYEENIGRELVGKSALVTGASTGLGREFALALAKKGCNVVVSARRLELLNSLCDEVHMLKTPSINPGKVAIVQLDVSASEPHIDAAVEKAWESFGSLDILVNNAGFRGSVKSPLDYEEQEWNMTINTNLRGAWLVSKAVAKRMRDAGRKGSIVNISTAPSVDRGFPHGAMIYLASKAGLNQLTKSMALELGRYGIRVNAIAAGIFKSEITKGIFEKDWFHKVATKIVPVQRWGNTNPDLTSLLLLLASDAASSYVTGNVFLLDGGYTLPALPLWSSL